MMDVSITSFSGRQPTMSQCVDRVEVWTVSFAQSGNLHHTLTDAECVRRDRFLNPSAKLQFAITRTVLRQVLSGYLGVAPLEIGIEPDADGKPQLHGRELQFNVSHTATHAVLAFSSYRVGVDIETIRPMASAEQLIARYFEPDEQEQYQSLPESERLRAFFQGWVGKEAVLKGLGCGTRRLDRCRVNLDPRQPMSIIGPAETQQNWQLVSWPMTPMTLIALAVETRKPLRLLRQ